MPAGRPLLLSFRPHAAGPVLAADQAGSGSSSTARATSSSSAVTNSTSPAPREHMRRADSQSVAEGVADIKMRAVAEAVDSQPGTAAVAAVDTADFSDGAFDEVGGRPVATVC